MIFVDILKKFADNATLGKAVVDIGPGFLFALSLLLVANVRLGFSVMPVDQIDSLDSTRQITDTQFRAKRAAFRAILTDVPGLEEEKLANADDTTLYELARRQIATLKADVATLDQNIGRVPPTDNTFIPLLEKRRTLASVHEQLLSQKAVVDTLDQRLMRLDNKLTEARSFSKNMKALTDNVNLLLVFSIILGVLISQVNRLLFVKTIYRFIHTFVGLDSKAPFMKFEPYPGAEKLAKISQEQRDNLVYSRYRYMEASINFIWPLMLLWYAFPAYLKKNLTVQMGSLWGRGCLALVIVLLITGYLAYRGYRNEEKALTNP